MQKKFVLPKIIPCRCPKILDFGQMFATWGTIPLCLPEGTAMQPGGCGKISGIQKCIGSGTE